MTPSMMVITGTAITLAGIGVHAGLTGGLVAWHRQGLFELRDRLFDYAADGGISFDDPEYRALESALNEDIALSERMGLITVSLAFAYYFILGPVRRASSNCMNVELVRIQDAQVRLTGLYILCRAPVLLPVLFILAGVRARSTFIEAAPWSPPRPWAMHPA